MYSIAASHLTGCEGVRVEARQDEVLAGEVGGGDGPEVGVVHTGLAGDEASLGPAAAGLGLPELGEHLGPQLLDDRHGRPVVGGRGGHRREPDLSLAPNNPQLLRLVLLLEADLLLVSAFLPLLI